MTHQAMTHQPLPLPAGCHSVNTYLMVEDVSKLIGFLKQTFGAREGHISADADGSIRHAEVYIGDSVVMMGGARDRWKPRHATIYVYIDDCDAVYQKALDAGAKSLMAPVDQFYGDRSGGFEDPCGNWWWVATHIEDVSSEEINRRYAAMGHKH